MINKKQIQKLLDVYGVPKNIREHASQVAKVTDFIADHLHRQNIPFNKKLGHAAASLHDLLRICDIYDWPPKNIQASKEDLKIWEHVRKKYKNVHHADAAYEILLNLGYKKIALIIKKHKFLSLVTPDAPETLEEKVVYYADKRVMHNQIVSLEERFADGEKRHAQAFNDSREEGRIAKKKTFELEKQIMNLAKLKPEEINKIP
ncbi:hypothetical protein KKG71_03615 [Patescibacteria group bacterium]|nr:hypothetical protein [Patescibacteria group bacterium]